MNRVSTIDTEDGDFETPPLKRLRKSEGGTKDVYETIEKLSSEVAHMAEKIEGFRKLSFKHKFPLSFLQSLDDCFTCCICKRSPPRTPLIGCQACSTLVGCQRCTDRWFGGINGLEKTCPKCRAPRGLSHSFVLKGFDSLVTQIKEMSNSTSSGSSEEDSDTQLRASPFTVRVDDD